MKDGPERETTAGVGVSTELLHRLAYLAKREELLDFAAEVLSSNRPMRSLFEKMGFDIGKKHEEGVYWLKMRFRGQEGIFGRMSTTAR